IGTVIFMIIMEVLRKAGFMPELWDGVVDSGVIANFQTIFNLVTAIILLPFTNLLVKFACAIVKDDEENEVKYPELTALDKKLMITPPLALAEVTKIAIHMANVAKDNFELSLKQFEEFDAERSELISATEEKLDCFTDRTDNYLIELSSHIKNASDKRHHNMLMQCISDIERIGDYATNFDELAKKKVDTEVSFSETAIKEFDIIKDAVSEIIRLAIEAMTEENDYVARRIEPLEEVIDDMVLLLKNRHRDRLCQGICSINGGLIFMDILTYLERTADQCSSIAMLLLGKNNDEISQNHHLYMQELHASSDQSYLAEQENRREQYLTPLKRMI
ncbi:MAG: Na/Pi cotransporter family protein, partial [Lachnospiraceae bacterium]|nr:Na/Pi cotransporter family protein [Lachnospiraceae bacterium]